MATTTFKYRRVQTLDVAQDDNFEVSHLKRQSRERSSTHQQQSGSSFAISPLKTKVLDFGDIVTAEVVRIELDAGQLEIRVDDPGTKATGQLVVVATASLVDGEIFTVSDGENTPVVFEYDVAGDGVQAGRRRVDVSAVVSDADVALVTALAIEQARVAGLLDVTASADGVTANVDLEAVLIGEQANVAITEAVANVGFTVTGMLGGTSFPITFRPFVAEGGVPIFLHEGIEAVKIELRNPSNGGDACGTYKILGRIT
jgi:hypothetical protein